jgi:hypothetical protein
MRQYLVKKIYVPIGYSYKITFYKKRRHGTHTHFYKKRFKRIRNRFPKIEDLDKELDQIEKKINENVNNDNKTEENKENQNQMKVDGNP